MYETEIETHGGNIYNAAEKYQIASSDILDFSSNINPLGIAPELKSLLTVNIDNLINYPDPVSQNLRKNISLYLKVPWDQIIVGNGASEIIYLVLGTLQPKRILLCAPTFSEYGQAATRARVAVDYYPLLETAEFKLNMDSFASQAKAYDCVLLCNPNNPTSGLIGRDEITYLLNVTKDSGTMVIIDEAFIELTIDGNYNSVVDLVAQYDQLFIIRAFTKILAVPGLRLGYGIGSQAVIEQLWAQKLPWSVNLLADSIGEYLAQAEAFLTLTSQWLQSEKDWLYKQLGMIPDLKPFQPQTNFILVKLLGQNMNSAQLKDKLAQIGILIRDAANFKTLNDQYFRLAVKQRADNIRLIIALQDIFSGFTPRRSQ